MAAAMKHAVVARGVGQVRLFGHRQGVHVGPQADRRSCRRPADDADDAGSTDPGRDLIHAPAAQALCHEGCRADLLEANLGMSVDVAADRSEFRVTIDDLGQQFHGVLRFDPET